MYLSGDPDRDPASHEGESSVLAAGYFLSPGRLRKDMDGYREQSERPQGLEDPSITSSHRPAQAHLASFLIDTTTLQAQADPPLPRKNGSFLEKSTGRLFRTSSMTATSTSE